MTDIKYKHNAICVLTANPTIAMAALEKLIEELDAGREIVRVDSTGDTLIYITKPM